TCERVLGDRAIAKRFEERFDVLFQLIPPPEEAPLRPSGTFAAASRSQDRLSRSLPAFLPRARSGRLPVSCSSGTFRPPARSRSRRKSLPQSSARLCARGPERRCG